MIANKWVGEAGLDAMEDVSLKAKELIFALVQKSEQRVIDVSKGRGHGFRRVQRGYRK